MPRWSRRPEPDETRPTLEGLGTRVEEILRLAERQAEDHRAEARRYADEIVATARREADEVVAAVRREVFQIKDGT